MARAKKGWQVKAHEFLIRKFRQAWRFYSEDRKACIAKSACAICGRPFPTPAIRPLADHVEPVDDPNTGFRGWDDHYDRLFYGKLQPLCENCHKKKSAEENKLRRERRKRLNGEKTSKKSG